MDETRLLIERAHRVAQEARGLSAENLRLRTTSRGIQQWSARVQGRVAGSADAVSFDRFSNRLLTLLPQADLDRLAPRFQGVHFRAGQKLHAAGSPIDYVYFPMSGVVSSRVVMQDGGAMELAAIGNEGVVGINVFVGGTLSPCDAVVSIPGDGLRIDVHSFGEELQQGLLRHILAGYYDAFSAQTSFQVGCTGLHSIRKRCCRQLLSLQDRMGQEDIPLTHELLSFQLGVRRSSVTEELGSLQKERAIVNSRGHIQIVDRPKLLLLACECYQATSAGFLRLFGSTGADGLPWPPAAAELATAP